MLYNDFTYLKPRINDNRYDIFVWVFRAGNSFAKIFKRSSYETPLGGIVESIESISLSRTHSPNSKNHCSIVSNIQNGDHMQESRC